MAKTPAQIFVLSCFSIMAFSAYANFRTSFSKVPCDQLVLRYRYAALNSPLARNWSASPWGEDRKKIRLMTFDVKYLRMQVPHLSLTPEPKPATLVRQQVLAFLQIRPDIVALQSVERGRFRDAQENLNSYALHELGGAYRGFAGPKSNDRKDVELGFLVRRDLAARFDFRIVSHVNDRVRNPENGWSMPRYVRDAPMLQIFEKGSRVPFFQMLNVQIRPSYVGYMNAGESYEMAEARVRRRVIAEIDGIEDIVVGETYQFPDTPLVVAGNWNRDLVKAPELEDLRRGYGLRESLDFLPHVSPSQRLTALNFVDPFGPPLSLQADGHLLSHHFRPRHLLATGSYRMLGPDGKPVVIPQSLEERMHTLGSDHFPVVVDVSTEAWSED